MHECNQAISGWKEYHMSENTISLYVYKGGQGEITEKKSRFIATVRPVESEDEAVSFINEILGCKAQLQCLCYRKETGTDQMLG